MQESKVVAEFKENQISVRIIGLQTAPTWNLLCKIDPPVGEPWQEKTIDHTEIFMFVSRALR